VFAATVKETVPPPVPLEVVVIHATFEVADHAQPVCVETLKLPLPPLCGIEVLVEESA
jgi:hypothetical protein